MQASDPLDPALPPAPRLGASRILLGLIQGLLLYLLYRAADARAWPATLPMLFAPLVLIAGFLPPLLISSLGHMRRRQWLQWALLVAVVLALLGAYDAWRNADLPLLPHDVDLQVQGMSGLHQSPLPGAPLLFFSAVGLSIAHSLVMAAARDRRRIASYPTHFDTAWTLGVQLAFSVLFTGASWLLLFLGAQLFELVKLDFLTRLLRKEWFAIPVTAFAFACAMHLTDVRPAIVRGIRGLLLVLLSWLLPVAVLLVAGFLAALSFTGLAPLWGTRRAASVLLCAAAAFVVLVNAAWQEGGDGPDAPAVARVLRLAARLAALLLAPLVLIAIYALFLRVRDYGWTGERVDAAACMLVALCYAAGYFSAALRPGWLPSLARVNIGVAFVVVGLLLALFSPLVDPARISVHSQLARLAGGKTAAADFDFAFLRFGGARFGRAALDHLALTASGPEADLVRRQIVVVRKMDNPWDRNALQPPADLAANLRMHPAGARLPASFLGTDWTAGEKHFLLPDCLRSAQRVCDAFLVDVNGDGKPEVLLFRDRAADSAKDRKRAYGGQDNLVLGENAQGRWAPYATLALPAIDCKRWFDSLAAGKLGVQAPVLADLDVGGERVRLDLVETKSHCGIKDPSR